MLMMLYNTGTRLGLIHELGLMQCYLIYGKVFPRKLQKQELQRPLPLERKYDWSYSGQAGISRSYRVGQIHL